MGNADPRQCSVKAVQSVKAGQNPRQGRAMRGTSAAPPCIRSDNQPTMNTTQHLQHLDKQHLWHPFTPMKTWMESDRLVITHARGMHLFDSEGRAYLDGVSSLWCNVHGHQ